jgi:hypothetical protein
MGGVVCSLGSLAGDVRTSHQPPSVVFVGLSKSNVRTGFVSGMSVRIAAIGDCGDAGVVT